LALRAVDWIITLEFLETLKVLKTFRVFTSHSIFPRRREIQPARAPQGKSNGGARAIIKERVVIAHRSLRYI
jgi:hypothetical protein